MKKRFSSRAWALLLAFALVLGLVPAAIAADADGQYADVPAGYWAADAIEYVTSEGLFKGVGHGRFAPESTMTRGMLVTILHRIDGSPAGGSHSFPDVSANDWYDSAVGWAAVNGVMQGDSAKFSPKENITMQTMAVALYNHCGAEAPTADKLAGFSDAADVSSWAKDQMNWAVSAGLYPIRGGDKLEPTKDLSRAEVAAVLQKYMSIWKPTVSVKGMTALWSPYQKVVALVLEYPQNVIAPSADSITITDYENALYNGAKERCDFTTAKVEAVYTNSVPELRAMRNSVEGRYVIVELEDAHELQEENGEYYARFAGISNVRYATGMKEGINTNNSMIRFDWSNYVVQLSADVINSEGEVVSPAGILPAMKADEITDLTGVDDFTTVDFTSSRGNKVYANLYVPENYDPSVAYPMVVEVSGNSQRLVFDENGKAVNPGTNLTRDTGAVGWLRVTDDVIILTVQPQSNPLNKDTYDEYEDTYELIQNVRGKYNVDSNRIYAMGSSFGTFHLSGVIQRHPDLFSVYVQCNGVFVDKDGMMTMYDADTDKVGGDYTSTNYLPESEYYDRYKAAMQASVENGLKVWVAHGVNDGSIPVTKGVSTYNMFTRLYKEAGKTDAEIADLVHLTIYENEDFIKAGAYNYHDALRLASADIDLMTWVLEQSKDPKAEINLLKNLPRAEDMVLTLDNYTGQMIEGYYNFNCPVSEGVNRAAKFYIPANTVYNQPTVFIAVPNGVNTWDFFVQSGWKDLADEEVFHAVLMEPANGKWGAVADEVAYIDALVDDVGKRPFFCSFESNFYGVAYGEAADILQNHSVDNPKRWAGIAVLGASGLTADKVSELQTTPSKVSTVMKSQVQTPVWITASSKTADVSRMINFYKSANHSKTSKDTASKYATEVYLPNAQTGSNVNVDETWCANVVFDAKDWKSCLNKTYSSTIYNELFKGVYRYPGDSNGALRRPGDINDRGFKYYSEKVAGGFNEDGSDLYQREWYVYVPKSVDTTKAAPLVFVFHGAGGSGNEIADRSGWAQVADEKGIIIVCPSASHDLKVPVRRVTDIVTSDMRLAWNTGDARADRPSDIKFVEYLYDWMQEHYKIDTTRVYASGQSSGGMMSWACAAKLPKIFAAAAPISAYNSPEPDTSSKVPVYCFVGELDSTFPGGFGHDTAKKTIEAWTAASNTVEKWSDYTYMDGGNKCSSKEGLFTNYLFKTADGVPMLQCVEVATKTHAIWPSECFKAWNNWFVNYTKDAQGNLYYQGSLVK